MKKVLYFTFPFPSHMSVSLEIIRELLKREIEIVVFANGEYQTKIEETGAVFKDYGVAFPINLNYIDANLAKYGDALVDFSYQVLKINIEFIKKENYNIIIHDYMCSWGRFAAEIIKLRAISVIPAYILTPEIMMEEKDLFFQAFMQSMRYISKVIKMQKVVRKIGKEFQIDAKKWGDVLLNQEYLNIATTHYPLQGGTNHLDSSYEFVGNLSVRRKENIDEFPFELLEQQKLVYISFGTVFRISDEIHFLFECLGNTDYKVILSTGKSISIEELGEVPENFIVKQSVPQLEILRRSSLFISHGGFNSVHEAVFFRVPMLLMPQMHEQKYIAKRCEKIFVGKVWTKNRKDKENFRKTVEELITSSEMQKSLRNISNGMSSDGAEKAADRIWMELEGLS